MFLGISSYTFPWAVSMHEDKHGKYLAAKHLVEYAISNEIKYVQFGDNLPLHLLAEEELSVIRTMADANNIGIEVGTRGLNLSNVQRYVQLAVFFRSPFIRMVIDDENSHPAVETVIETIRALLPLLQQNKLILAIENHDRFPAAVLKEIILQTDKELVGICLDTANSLGAGEGVNEILQSLAPFVVNLHIKDIRVQRVAHKMGFAVQGVAAGEGIINIPHLVKILSQTGRCRTATLEVWSDPCDTPEQTVKNEQVMVTKSIQYLKQLLQ